MGVKMLTVADVAEITGYSEWTIRKFCRQGLLDSTKRAPGARQAKNTRIMIHPDALERFIGRAVA